MLIAIPFLISTPVNAAPVNWLPSYWGARRSTLRFESQSPNESRMTRQ
jgi:hypothetical protein